MKIGWKPSRTPATAVAVKACWPANKTGSAAQTYLSGHQRLSDNIPHRPSIDLVPEPVMHSPTQSLACFLSWILLFIPWLYPRPLSAAERPWIEFRDCRYIEHEYNDGDSFRLQCGEQAFVARIYFVDAPESKLRNPDRVQEQSEHFGITIDEVLRGGHQAARVVREALHTPSSSGPVGPMPAAKAGSLVITALWRWTRKIWPNDWYGRDGPGPRVSKPRDPQGIPPP